MHDLDKKSQLVGGHESEAKKMAAGISVPTLLKRKPRGKENGDGEVAFYVPASPKKVLTSS